MTRTTSTCYAVAATAREGALTQSEDLSNIEWKEFHAERLTAESLWLVRVGITTSGVYHADSSTA